MKRLAFFILLMCSCFYSMSAVELWQRDSVFQCPGKSAQEITMSAKAWANSYFAIVSPIVSAHDNVVFVYLDMMKFSISNWHWAAGSGYLSGMVRIIAREGRYKVVLSNFNHISADPDYSNWWSMGTILEDIPEEWKHGWKWKQKREVYKRVLEKLNSLANSTFKDASEIITRKTKVEDDW